ncbi:MAG: DUF5814 domain-containing protein [Candidatus Thorarchaeota archaeon]|nr:DUF5814 domain-containing protein [Candidatus Thorarchaeota archaeon]
MEVADARIQKLLSKPFTMVFRKTRQELSCRIEVYSAVLKDRQRAQLAGLIEFGEKQNGLLEIRRSWFVKFNKPVYYQPKEFHEILRKAKGIIIPKEASPPFLKKLLNFLERIQTTKPNIVSVCMHCLREDRLTVLTRKNAVKVSATEVVCMTCALADLKSELKSIGVKMSRGMLRQLEFQVARTKSVPRVIEMLMPGFDPTRDPDLTLVDTIDAIEVGVKKKVADLPLPDDFKKILKKNGYVDLLPVQNLAISEGLLEGKSLLIVSSTSSGKTLIGELAGIPRAMKGKKMLYLSPLVALTNEKYELWRKRYRELGLRTGIKVGMSRLDVGKEGRPIIDTDVSKSDIICATYEALDLIFRSRETKQLGEIGTVIVDEIQNLADPERGPELDGLLVRLRHHAPRAQILALSATVGTPEQLAKELRLKLVNYTGRPVPLERHLVFARNDEDKWGIIRKLVVSEFRHISSSGNRGQTIIFTFSRRRAHALSDWLRDRRVSATVYHGGLSYYRRRRVEHAFTKQRYACVVTTAALGAGVDLPASQVIFESLAMGANWLSIAEFEQMLGRAGRLGKHDRGKVYVVVEPDRKYHSGQDRTEDAIAAELLNGVVEDVEPFADLETSAEQALASISATGVRKLEDVARVYRKHLSMSVPPSDALKHLVRHHMVRVQNGINVTALGKATTLSFLKPTEGLEVYKLTDKMDVLDIAIKLEPFENVYLSSKLQGEVDSAFKTHMPTRLFSGVFSDISDLSQKRGGAARLPSWVFDVFAKWASTFFNCGCPLYPECDHGKIRLGRWLVEHRKAGLNPTGLAKKLHDEFHLWAYPGDIYSWLDSLIHNLKAVQRIAAVAGKVDLGVEIEGQIAMIEKPLKEETGTEKSAKEE